jgi:hypothetical protein
MDHPKIHPQGYWLSGEEGHCFDPTLAQQLELLLQGKSVCDFGCGPGKYVNWLRKSGIECDGYDGNPNTNALSLDVCQSINLAEPINFQKQYDAIISLEVAEHIPKQYESIFLDNLAIHAREMIVLSWAVPGQLGDGHVNCRMNSYAAHQLGRRGFRLQPAATISLRKHCSLPWFGNSLMVFSRTRAPFSSAEFRAAAHIVFQDLSRLNSDNSSVKGAFVGKLSRTCLQLKGKLGEITNKITNIVRLLRYDAENLLRSRAYPSERLQNPSFFFPVVFTCGRHFGPLRLALKSLSLWAPPIKEINIYVDNVDLFSFDQCEVLRLESRYSLNFHKTLYPMAWAGSRLILNELYAFRKLAAQMRSVDFLVKFDSDVIFLSDAIFQFVANSEAGAIGTSVRTINPEIRDDYMQGGCYFIRGTGLRALVKSRITGTALWLAREWSHIVEDQFISTLIRKCRTKMVYNEFLYYDAALAEPKIDETELEARLRTIPAKVSVLHFEGNKSNMRLAAEKLLPSLASGNNRHTDAT